jgi:hypothetical protein
MSPDLNPLYDNIWDELMEFMCKNPKRTLSVPEVTATKAAP